MNCPHCNADLATNTPFCPFCGEKLDYSDKALAEESQVPAADGQDEFSEEQSENYAKPLEPAYPMKWYKWLINFALWFGGIFNIFYSFNYFSGWHFISDGYSSDQISLIYEYLPALQVADILFGIFLVLDGIICIYVRYALKNFKTFAPRLLTVRYVFQIVTTIIYNFSYYLIFTAEGITVTLGYYVGYTIGQCIVLIPFLICNYHYFKRRKSLFVN